MEQTQESYNQVAHLGKRRGGEVKWKISRNNCPGTRLKSCPGSVQDLLIRPLFYFWKRTSLSFISRGPLASTHWELRLISYRLWHHHVDDHDHFTDVRFGDLEPCLQSLLRLSSGFIHQYSSFRNNVFHRYGPPFVTCLSVCLEKQTILILGLSKGGNVTQGISFTCDRTEPLKNWQCRNPETDRIRKPWPIAGMKIIRVSELFALVRRNSELPEGSEPSVVFILECPT